MTHLNVTALTVAIGVVIPFVTAVVAKEAAPAWAKALINVVISAVAGALTLVVHNGGNVRLSSMFLNIAAASVTSIVAYKGLWSPTGVTDGVVHLLQRIGIKVTPTQANVFEEAFTAGEHWIALRLEELAAHLGAPGSEEPKEPVQKPEPTPAPAVGDDDVQEAPAEPEVADDKAALESAKAALAQASAAVEAALAA